MNVELVKIFKSTNGNGIKLFEAKSRFYNKKNSSTIFFIGVFHGDEPEGETLIYNLMSEINKDIEIIANNRILFIPCLNPDGKTSNIRGNANKVDLNRNFPTKNWELSKQKDKYYSGASPESEVETKYLISLIEQYSPDAIIALHTPYKVVNYDGPAKELAEKISELTGYPVEENIGYPTPGSFGTYCGIERKIATITLELPDNESVENLWDVNKEAFFQIIKSEL